MQDWSNIAYLQRGTEHQQEAYRALLASDLFMVLADYDPILIGPLALGLESTVHHLDILCATLEPDTAAADLSHYYQDAPGFELESTPGHILCRFIQNKFTLEISIRPEPFEARSAFQILSVADRLLRMAGDDARRGIQSLLHEGMPLHSALAAYFRLPGEPDTALAELYTAPYADLEALVIAAAHSREPYRLPFPA